MAPLKVEFCCKLCGLETLAGERFETASPLGHPEGYAIRKLRSGPRSTVVAPFKMSLFSTRSATEIEVSTFLSSKLTAPVVQQMFMTQKYALKTK